MKYLIALFFIALLFLWTQDAQALVKIDSVYADSCYQDGNYNVVPRDSAAMFKKPDSAYGHLSGDGPLIDMAFKKYKSNEVQVIKAGSTILVWGKKDAGVDSSAGQIVFNKAADDGTLLATSMPIILGDGLNIVTVPNDDYTYVELSLAAPLDHGSMNHSKGYFIDAVALLQDTTTPLKDVVGKPFLPNSIASFPNPFVTNTTIRFVNAFDGDVELSVIDALGRETDRVNPGYFESGVHEIPLTVRNPGMFFVRVFVGGKPLGNPLKITSR